MDIICAWRLLESSCTAFPGNVPFKKKLNSLMKLTLNKLTLEMASSGTYSGIVTTDSSCSLNVTIPTLCDTGVTGLGCSHAPSLDVLKDSSNFGVGVSGVTALTRQLLGVVCITSSAIWKMMSKLITSWFSLFCESWLCSLQDHTFTGYPAYDSEC